MHMTSVLTVISNQNAKLDKQGERLSRMEEVQQKQGEHIAQVKNSYTKQESDMTSLQSIITSNAEKLGNFQKDLKSQLEQIGIDLQDLQTSATSSRETTPTSAVVQSENLPKLMNEKLQSLIVLSSPSSASERSPSAQFPTSPKYEADVAVVLSKLECLPDVQRELAKVPEVRFSPIFSNFCRIDLLIFGFFFGHAERSDACQDRPCASRTRLSDLH
jgi:hypothetical protein